MKADDEERDPAEAEREVRVGWIRADGRVPSVMRRVEVVEILERPPQALLEGGLIRRMRAHEAGQVRRERLVERRQFLDEGEQVAREARGRGRRTQFRVEAEAIGAAPDGRLAADARELLVQHQGAEAVMDK